MGDENLGGGMNLDLNLGTGSLSPETNDTTTSVNLEDWIEGQHLPTNLLRETSRSRIWRWHSLWSGTGTAASASPAPVPFEARSIASEFILNTATLNGDFLHTGEGSERNTDVVKECKNEGVGIEDEGKIGKNEEEEKEGGNEGSFFECNICLDVSSDPVLTCCGHLFCWPCLYQWINVHSDSKECPVCKGEVTVKNLTPIYGRGSSTTNEHISSLKIPDRPQAKRVESWRQTIQRNAFAFPMDEMLRRLGSGSDFSRDFIENHPPGTDSVTELIERNSSLLNRILTSRGMRQEQTLTPPQEDADDVDLTNTRSHTYRGVPTGEIVNIARRFVGYTGGGRGEEQALPVEDRDSVSSIAAVIHSESQTLDTAVEIDSTVSLSTSSSRRRVDASRVSDVDSGNSRAPRRRRFN